MRIVYALFVAFALSTGIAKALDVPFNPCWMLPADSWLYKALGCSGDAGGGGGSGAGD